MMRFRCLTTFDITATGITGHFKSNRVPFVDQANQNIDDVDSWNRARNQQRNWETLTQLISLRTQITDIIYPEKNNNMWIFEFTAESSGAYGSLNDPTEILRWDSDGVPMIVELSGGSITEPLITSGTEQNIWFDTMEENDEY
jgi:hypothetical protein